MHERKVTKGVAWPIGAKQNAGDVPGHRSWCLRKALQLGYIGPWGEILSQAFTYRAAVQPATR